MGIRAGRLSQSQPSPGMANTCTCRWTPPPTPRADSIKWSCVPSEATYSTESFLTWFSWEPHIKWNSACWNLLDLWSRITCYAPAALWIAGLSFSCCGNSPLIPAVFIKSLLRARYKNTVIPFLNSVNRKLFQSLKIWLPPLVLASPQRWPEQVCSLDTQKQLLPTPPPRPNPGTLELQIQKHVSRHCFPDHLIPYPSVPSLNVLISSRKKYLER